MTDQSPGDGVRLDFGDHCTIEQHRFGAPNEFYLHKVIGVSRSNAWVDVPVTVLAVETIHPQMEDVVSCICCGVQEKEVLKYRLSDVLPPSASKWNTQSLRQQLAASEAARVELERLVKDAPKYFSPHAFNGEKLIWLNAADKALQRDAEGGK